MDISKVPKFDETTLEEVCNILGATNDGLTGSEIGNLLSKLGIPDINPNMTKRIRLSEALSVNQNVDDCGNNIVAFIQMAMNPIRFTNCPEYFESQRMKLNKVLAFVGLLLHEDGKIRLSEKIKTLSEVQVKINRLEAELLKRKIHPEVLKFCREELANNNLFHAVLEATKSVAEKIRAKTGLTGDGADIVDKAFGLAAPLLQINELQTDTDKSEQKGFANILKGMFGVFRNISAHKPRVSWQIDEQDALDLLSLISYLHRRLDKAVCVHQKNTAVANDEKE